MEIFEFLLCFEVFSPIKGNSYICYLNLIIDPESKLSNAYKKTLKKNTPINIIK